jgi:iron complex outermembrane recepter protein
MSKITPHRLLPLVALLMSSAWAQESGKAEAAEANSTLPVVRVQGSKESASGPVSGFVARRAGSANKTDTPLIETPQAISVITADQIEAQGATTLRQTTAYAAGVVSSYFDSRVDSFTARGGSVTQYLDGLLRSYGTYNTAKSDPYTLERVELVRGPASVLYGQGSIGGVLNLVSKRPQVETRREVQLQVGSFDRKQIAADLTGAIDRAGEWSYRLVAIKRDSGSQIDHVDDDRVVLAPTLTWRPSAATSLTVQALYQRDKSGSLIGFFPWKGTQQSNAPYGQIPTSTFISEPGWDAYDSDQDSLGYLFSHQFNDTWTLRQNLRYTESAVDYRTIYTSFTATGRPVINDDGRTVERDMVWQLNGGTMVLLDTQLESKWGLGRWEHTALLGLDAQKNRSSTRSASGRAPAIDLYDPVYGNFTPLSRPTTPATVVEQRQLGLYLQDHIKFDQRWVAVLGLRHDRAKTNASAKVDDEATSKRAGLLYLGEGGWSPYLSYSESFQPLGGLDYYGTPYKPQVGEQWEAGVKWQPADRRLSASATVYELRDTNRKTTDPNQPLNNLQIGEVTVRGLELESAGSLPGNWDWTLGYAYTDAEISRSNAGDQGQPVSGVAKHTGSAWLSRHFSIAGRSGFSAGLGLRYIGDAWSGTTLIRTPSSTLVDAMLGYDHGDWRLGLNAVNLRDKVQITQCLARGDCFYGQRRTVNATLSYRF